MNKSKQKLSVHDKKLKSYQWSMFLTLYFSFVCFTATKRGLGLLAVPIIESRLLTSKNIGELATTISITFAFSKVIFLKIKILINFQ